MNVYYVQFNKLELDINNLVPCDEFIFMKVIDMKT